MLTPGGSIRWEIDLRSAPGLSPGWLNISHREVQADRCVQHRRMPASDAAQVPTIRTDVCVCVCVRERERERETECVCVREIEIERGCVSAGAHRATRVDRVAPHRMVHVSPGCDQTVWFKTWPKMSACNVSLECYRGTPLIRKRPPH